MPPKALLSKGNWFLSRAMLSHLKFTIITRTRESIEAFEAEEAFRCPFRNQIGFNTSQIPQTVALERQVPGILGMSNRKSQGSS